MLVKAIDFDHTGTGTGDSFIIYNLNCTYDPLSKSLNRGVTISLQAYYLHSSGLIHFIANDIPHYAGSGTTILEVEKTSPACS